jgi:hypothetical protein
MIYGSKISTLEVKSIFIPPVCFTLFISLPPFVGILYLIGYHHWLGVYGISTYQHIKFKKEVKAKRWDMEHDIITKQNFEEWLKLNKL